MKLDEADLEQSYFQPIGKSVDTSIGYVLVAVIVVLFFAVLLSGIQKVQNATNHVVRDQSQFVSEPPPEIGDTTDSGKPTN